jgi:hypothetical protein
VGGGQGELVSKGRAYVCHTLNICLLFVCAVCVRVYIGSSGRSVDNGVIGTTVVRYRIAERTH